MIPLPPATAQRSVWLHVGELLDGTCTIPRRDAHVVYDDRAIRFVGDNGRTPPADVLQPGQTAPDAVVPDATVLPGLIEAHAHLFLEGGELDLDKRAAWLRQSPADLLAAARSRLVKLARFGLAGIRDAGDKDGVGPALSRWYREERTRPANAARLPYIDSPGAAIHRRGRYGSFMGEPLEDHAHAAACVAARVAAGADRIKLIPTGIINFKQGAVTTAPQMTTAEVAALVAAARQHGRQTFAHASGDAGIEVAIEGGVDTVEHGFFVREDQLARMRDRRIGWVPTFAPVQVQVDEAARFGWDDTVRGNLQRILDNHAASLRRARELGVLIIAGSDAGSCGVAHALGFYYELELMERAGLRPLDVINAATGTSAGRLGFREDFGRVAPGCLSRLIVTRHSPAKTVANLRQPGTVVFDGAVLPLGGEPAGL